jgi:D-alanyl-D-alanine carboxypeptidase (penicillin-binding protein 5/6)
MRASAYDLAVIAATVSRRYSLFRSIVATKVASIPATSNHPVFWLDNVNGLFQKYAPAVGIKPGWTGDAGACEVGMAVRDGHRLISVLMHGTLVYTASARLLDWGFSREGLPALLPPPPSPTAR